MKDTINVGDVVRFKEDSTELIVVEVRGALAVCKGFPLQEGDRALAVDEEMIEETGKELELVKL